MPPGRGDSLDFTLAFTSTHFTIPLKVELGWVDLGSRTPQSSVLPLNYCNQGVLDICPFLACFQLFVHQYLLHACFCSIFSVHWTRNLKWESSTEYKHICILTDNHNCSKSSRGTTCCMKQEPSISFFLSALQVININHNPHTAFHMIHLLWHTYFYSI